MAYRIDLPHLINHVVSFVMAEKGGKVEMPCTLRNTTYSKEMNIVLGMTTRWVAAAAKKKYDVVVNTDISYFFMFAEEGDFVISAAKTKFMLQKKG
ncbi:hypothetical protein PHPALM_19749 [Phytophthora palmivora]|uniref:Uncharacterized protein n=1 Tax=Phytophthora palmivora TaxID=4796 RepID=A0A2P4XGN9_9STRA|nr:hypothetical protein PHPALM_19749 [Phytophthora palmivora]